MALIFCRNSSISSCTASRSCSPARSAHALARPGRCRNLRGGDRPGRPARGAPRWPPGPGRGCVPRSCGPCRESSALRRSTRVRWRSSNSRWLMRSMRLAGKRLLAQIELGDLRFGPQDAPLRRARPARRTRPVVGGRRRCARPRSCRLSSNCRSCVCKLRSRSSPLASSTLVSVVSRTAGAAAAPPGRRSARPAPPGCLPISARPASSWRRFSRASASRLQGRLVLRLGCAEFGIEHFALLVELRAPLKGGGDFRAMLGQRRPASGGARPCAVGLVLVGRQPAAAARASGRLRLFDLVVQFGQLDFQCPQLAAPRDQAGWPLAAARQPACRRPANNSPAKVTKLSPRPAERANSRAWPSCCDDPGLTQQSPGQRGKSRLGLDEAIGTAQHARPALQIDLLPSGSRRLRIQPDKTHAAAKTRRLGLQVFQQFRAVGRHHVLSGLAQGHVNQRRHFHAHRKHVGHQAQDGRNGPPPGCSPGSAPP